MDLSSDILCLILRFLTPSSLFNASLVSRSWNVLSTGLLYAQPLLLSTTKVDERFEQLLRSLRREELSARVMQPVIPVRGGEKDRPRLGAVEEMLGSCARVQSLEFEGTSSPRTRRRWLTATQE